MSSFLSSVFGKDGVIAQGLKHLSGAQPFQFVVLVGVLLVVVAIVGTTKADDPTLVLLFVAGGLVLLSVIALLRLQTRSAEGAMPTSPRAPAGIPKEESAVRARTRRRWIWAAYVALVVGGIGVAIGAVLVVADDDGSGPSELEATDVFERTPADATSALEAAGFEVVDPPVTVCSNSVAEGLVRTIRPADDPLSPTANLLDYNADRTTVTTAPELEITGQVVLVVSNGQPC